MEDKTNELLSPLILGAWWLGGINQIQNISLGWNDIDSYDAEKIISCALNRGIKTIDTSDFYGCGKSEMYLGKILNKTELGKKCKIATKGGLIPEIDNKGKLKRNFNPEYLEKALSLSLKRLQRNYIDIYQLHGPNRSDIFNNKLWFKLNSFKREGLVKSLGVSLKRSETDPEFLKRIIDNTEFDTIQLPINPLQTHFVKVMIDLDTKGKKIFVRSPFYHGLLLKENYHSIEKSFVDHRKDKLSVILKKQLYEFRTYLSNIKKIDGANYIIKNILLLNKNIRIVFGATKIEQIEAINPNILSNNFIDNKYFWNMSEKIFQKKDISPS
jgi:aryl-alcohol dehydrogenase-like predicted oxidoreductase